jgi:L-rhamnose mutarotase
MLEALRASGWGNYSLFLREDGQLIGYVTSGQKQGRAGGEYTGAPCPLQRLFRPI